MLRSTTCSGWLITLLACSSGKLQLVAVLVFTMSTSAPVDHCRSWLVCLNGSLSALALVRINSLVPELTRDLTSRVLDCLSFLASEMTSLTNIIGLKCTCFSFLSYLVYLSLLVSFCRVFNKWSSFNDLPKVLELNVCSLIFDILLGSNLSMINPYMQPLSKMFSLLPMELLPILSSSSDSES